MAFSQQLLLLALCSLLVINSTLVVNGENKANDRTARGPPGAQNLLWGLGPPGLQGLQGVEAPPAAYESSVNVDEASDKAGEDEIFGLVDKTAEKLSQLRIEDLERSLKRGEERSAPVGP